MMAPSRHPMMGAPCNDSFLTLLGIIFSSISFLCPSEEAKTNSGLHAPRRKSATTNKNNNKKHITKGIDGLERHDKGNLERHSIAVWV